MQRIRCIETCTHEGAERITRAFTEGQVYEVSDELAPELLRFSKYFEVAPPEDDDAEIADDGPEAF